MAKPTTRQELKDYALRQLGYPVLEINVADEQVDDALDDSLQLFYERHFDGVERVFLKYKLTDNDISRGRARGGGESLGITTSSTGDGGTTTISGDTYWDDVIVRHTFDSDFTDSSPVGNSNITAVGNPDIVASPAKFGKAGRFQGSNKYLNYGHNAAYDFRGEWTFETWIYIDTSPAAGAIFSKGDVSNTSNIFGLLVDNTSTGLISFRWFNSSNTTHNSTYGTTVGAVATGSVVQNWVHIALTRRASDGTIHFFFNGTESSLTSSNQVIDNNISNSNLRYLTLNARLMYQQSRFTDAIYDDVRITAKERYTSNFTVPASAFPTDGTLTTSAGGEVQDYEENTNFLTVPDSVLGIERVHTFDNSNVSSGMFSIKYQLFLNDLAFDLGYQGLMNYAMTKTYLEDIDFLLTTSKQVRYNKRNNRLYLDIDWSSAASGTYVIIECYRIMDPANYAGVYNDSFLKRYFTSRVKKQWGQNLIKFQGVKLPGGIELNGRQIYEDAVQELQQIEDKMLSTYEIPPLDMIG